MPITTTTPYKSGTLFSIGTGANGVNTRLNTSGISWTAGDVGRHVYFYSGNAKWESREIIAQGTNYCDILFPFGEYPVLKPDGTEVPSDTPSNGNSLGVSYKLDDLDDGSTLIKESVNFYRHTTSNAWTIGQNVMIHDTNKTLEFNSEWVDLDGIMQFGNLDSDGFVRDSCCLMDNSTGFGGFSQVGNNVSTSDDFGSFRLFGGAFLITGTTQFLRIYRNSGTSEAVQVQAVNFNGAAGGRVDGTKSYFLDPIYSNLSSSIGPINPKSNVAMIKGIRVNSGAQVVYHFWSVSKSITVPGIRFNPNGITDRFARLNSNSSGHTLTLDDILVGDIQTLQDNGITIFDQQSSLSGSNIVKITNPLTVKTQNNASGMRLRIKNTNGTEVFDENSDGNGDWAKTSYEWGRVTISALTTYDLDNAVIVAPYTCNTRKYDKITQSFSFDARSPLSTVIPDVADSSITETTKATVLAYGTLETLDKFRDRHKAEHVDNDDVEDISAGGGAVDLTTSTNIETSYTGYALIIDSIAAAWSHSSGTITIGASTLTSGSNYTNLIPFSTLTFANGATASCNVILNNTVVATTANQGVLTGNVNINNGGRLDLVDLTTNQLIGTGASGGRIKINGASTSTIVDLRAYTINSGFEIENNSGIAVTVKLLLTQTNPTLIQTSGTLTIDKSVIISAPNILDDSYVRLFNVTTATELDLSTVSGGSGYSYSFIDGVDGSVGNEIRLDVALYNPTGPVIKEMLRLTGTLTSTGLTFNQQQSNWTAMINTYNRGAPYNNPATITGYTLDVANIEVDATVDPIDGWEIASWLYYQIVTTTSGMRNYFQSFVALDDSNFRIDDSIVDLKFDNTSGTPSVWNNASWTRSDGTSIVADTSGTIDFQNGLINVISVSGTKDSTIDDILVHSRNAASNTQT